MSLFAALRTSALLMGAAFAVSVSPAGAATWLPYGPDGGDARALAADPANHAHLYLGTLTGWIYESSDSGTHWKRLAQIGRRDDLALDNILVDPTNPKHITVGAWVLDHADGGLFQSHDGGLTWASAPELRGQSIRSLTESPSDPKMMVVGTLTGIFRTTDSGARWERISPVDNAEIHNVESLAVDPLDPQTIYAGTWHLPWKTIDGGLNWTTIKKGVIDDSDVFSIIVDPKNPNVVFVSACSGIYKSEDKGEQFHKVQGIPSSARRTRVLMQDPKHLDTVFAGTTEGLFRTDDAGKDWSRTTGPEVIVNDVFVDPTDSRRVLLATDRGGVLTSDDGGSSFLPSNTGFSARQITASVTDPSTPGTVYAGVVNDKEWGGVFVSHDGGLAWAQQSDGLNGQDVFSLGQATDGSLVAGTGHGIYRFEEGRWNAAEVPGASTPAVEPVKAKAVRAAKGKAAVRPVRKAVVAPVPPTPAFDGIVYGFATLGPKMYAGTSMGMLVSETSGRTWKAIPALKDEEWRFVAAGQRTILAASLNGLMISVDAGENWSGVTLPEKVKQVSAAAVDDKGELWIGGREGVFLSSDRGASWQTLQNLYVRNVDSLYFDQRSGEILVTANGQATLVFAMHVADRKVSFWDAGWTLRFVRPVGDHLLGVTLFDGVVIQPRMVDLKEVAAQ